MTSDQGPGLLLEHVTRVVIGVFFDVFNELSGFPEYVLRRALKVALEESGLTVREEVTLPVWFRGHLLTTFRADLVVDPGVIVEVKTSTDIQPFHKVQLLHYLKASGLEVGLLLNFGRRPEHARVVYQQARNRDAGDSSTE
jgi:GxxExxY protein